MRRALARAIALLAACLPLIAARSDLTATTWAPVPLAATADPNVLVQNYPQSAAVWLRLLNRQLARDDRDGALRSLGWLAAHGHVFSPGSQLALHDMLAKWGKPKGTLITPAPRAIEASAQLAVVPQQAQLVEAVVRDSKTGRLFASTVVSRQLWTRPGKGAWSTIPLAGADSISGMVIDPGRRILWVSSGDIGMGQGPSAAFHGIVAISLDSLRELRRISAPAGVNPSDLTLGCRGALYVSDPLGGGIYRAGQSDSALSVLIAPGTFRSPQGLAQSADCALLYVSDYGYGLAAIRLKDRQPLRIDADPSLRVPLDGIDGLWRQGNTLIAIQNGTSPSRIVQFKIGPSQTSVVSAEVLEQAHSGWSEPLSGGIAGHALIYVANGQWDRFEDGKPVSGKSPSPTQVRLLPLRTIKH